MMFEGLRKPCCPTDARRSETPGAGACCAADESRDARAPSHGRADGPKLEDLIPIAVVVAAGCEGCAERMVRRAVEAGSAARHILRTLAIVADLRERECFRASIAPDVVERMNAPLARARTILGELMGTRAAADAPSAAGDPEPAVET